MESTNDGTGFDILFGILPAFLGYFAFNVPFWLTLVYLVFGSEFFLFAWIDDMLVFLITHWVSNITPLIHIFSLFVFLLYLGTNRSASDALKAFF